MSIRFPLPVVISLFLGIAGVVCLYAQEEDADIPPPAPPPVSEAETPALTETPIPMGPPVTVQVLTPEQHRIDMDIRTSTLTELAAWSRSLGLSEGGTSADLARRLREHFKITEQAPPSGEDKRKIITIESARTTEYFTITEVDEEYARLSGEVKVSLKDGDAVHRIQAWNILFNRTRNILTASGGVEYIKEEGDKIETFRGDSITVDLDNWESIFLGGVSERALQSDNTTYLFAGTVISKDTEDVTVLNKASISSAKSEESLWSLNATRVWLLPGSDFAIFNALLKVGEIPVLYIPFFYYPADEVIFHPVIGFRTKEGNFVQTTTYLLGRPKASTTSESSLTKILGNSKDMEKKREGLFLRSTGKKATDPNAVSLRAILDYYANLGGYVGADFEMPAKGILGATSLSLGLGFSRTVYQEGSTYTPFFPDYDGTSDWNSSNLFSAEVPFRYRFKASSSLSGSFGSFTWNLPHYSDPLVEDHFMDRAEEMDWINMIQQGAAMDEEESTQNEMTSYSWELRGQINKLPRLEPYITPTLSGISSTLSFRTLRRQPAYSQNDIKYYSPTSSFYAPDTATLYSTSGTISGTPLSFGETPSAAAKPASSSEDGDEEMPDPLKNIGIPRSPFETIEPEDTKETKVTEKLVLPDLTQRFDLPRTGNTRFSVAYRIAPSTSSTLKFNYQKWNEYGDVDWSDISSILFNFGGDASTTLNLNHSENFFTSSFTYSGNGTWRQYGYLNEEAEEYLTDGEADSTKVETAKKNEYKASFFSTSYNLNTTLRPLFRNSVFGSSSLSYTLKGLAFKSSFLEDSTADAPDWEIIYGEWTKEKLDSHQFSTNISALIMDKTQTLTLSAELPPRDSALSWSAAFRVWITETSGNMRIQFPGEEDKRKLEPFYFTEKINFGSYGSFSQNVVLDTEKKGEVTSLTSALSLPKWGITANFAATRQQGYEYIPPGTEGATTTGWVQKKGDPTLQPRDFTLNFSKSVTVKELWDKRLQFSVSNTTNLKLDLQRYTSSTLTFSLGFTVGINKFLDLSMSARSENAAMYRYLRDLPFFADAPIDLPEGRQNNFFLDLFDSFRFDDESARQRSGFKMKSFSISATHYLGDWNAILNWNISPYRPPNERHFEMNNEVSFLLQWIPISELKSDISYNKSKDPEWTVKQ